MPIEVVCHCGSRFAARDDLAGTTVACPTCNLPLAIEPSAPPAAFAQTGVTSILDELGVRQVDKNGIVCPKCSTYIPIGTMVCGSCHYNVQTASFQPHRKKVEGTKPSPRVSLYSSELRKPAPLLGSVVDEELTFSEIALCAFLGCLMFPYGLILFARGHAKGILIMLGSLIIPAILMLLYVLISFMFTIPMMKKAQAPTSAPAAVCTAQRVDCIEFRATF